MPPVIARYRAANPQIKVELFDSLAGPALSMLREGRVDMAITSGEDLREFECMVLRLEKFFFVCRDDHPMADKSSVSLLQVAGADMMHLARSSSVRQHLQVQPAMLAAPPHGLEVEHLATLAALIAQGLGVSVVPELTLFHFRRDRLKAIPIRDRQLRRPIVLARHKAVNAVWAFGAPELSKAVEAHSAGNLKRTFVDYGRRIDWSDPKAAEGAIFLRRATEIKNIWVPYGE